jgi:septal ring factor EnvC (AmiA/AmiB activator)
MQTYIYTGKRKIDSFSIVVVNTYTHLTAPFSTVPLPPSLLSLHSSLFLQLSRDKKTLEEKLQETQTALETEENKAKQEHRQRLKLESHIQDLDEKLHRETNVSSPDCANVVCYADIIS